MQDALIAVPLLHICPAVGGHRAREWVALLQGGLGRLPLLDLDSDELWDCESRSPKAQCQDGKAGKVLIREVPTSDCSRLFFSPASLQAPSNSPLKHVYLDTAQRRPARLHERKRWHAHPCDNLVSSSL